MIQGYTAVCPILLAAQGAVQVSLGGACCLGIELPTHRLLLARLCKAPPPRHGRHTPAPIGEPCPPDKLPDIIIPSHRIPRDAMPND